MELVDLKTLSKDISISVFKLRKFAKTGMPHYRVGNKILVNPQEFEDWFERFKRSPDFRDGGLGQLVDEVLG